MNTVKSPLLKAMFLSAALVAGAPLAAQTAAPAPAAPATPPAEATAPAAPATAGTYSDAEVKQFTEAAMEVTKVQSDTTIPAAEKQPKMLAALQAKGMDPAKFNTMGQAVSSDPTLQQRVQAAASATAPAASAAPATPPAATPAEPATPAAPAQPMQ